MTVVTPGREYSALNITTREFWSQPFAIRDKTFARLGANDGLEEAGFWALTS